MIIDVIKTINKLGIQVLEINDTYYASLEFRNSDNNVPYHYIKGRDITSLLTGILVGMSDRDAIFQKIEVLPISEAKFSKDYTWKWFIS